MEGPLPRYIPDRNYNYLFMTDHHDTSDRPHPKGNGRGHPTSDATIPAPLKAQLVAALAEAKREVRKAQGAGNIEAANGARQRVEHARIALGAHDPSGPARDGKASLKKRLESTVVTLLYHRDIGKSICPSEAARVVGAPDAWREIMPTTREVAVKLARENIVSITRGDHVLDPEQLGKGHLRLRRGQRF